MDPHTPIAQGWLRASHRKLDKKKSLPYRPWHTHDEKQPLTPGETYESRCGKSANLYCCAKGICE
jgi:predicted acyl esterase